MRKGKRLWGIAIAVVCLLCSFVFVACNKDDPVVEPPAPPVGELTISQTSVQLDMHEQVQLTVAESGETKWTSGNTAVCSVENGLVKSVGVGVTTVTASQGDSYATCTVTVSNSRSAPQIEIQDDGASVGGQMIRAMSDAFTLAAFVTYKNADVAATDVSEWQWSVDDATVLTLTPAEDKKSANVVCAAYGITTVRIAAVVWGEPISKAIEVSVRNTNVTFSSSAWEADEDGVFATSITTVTADGTAVEADLDIVCKDGETDVSSSVQWSASKENVVSVTGGKLTAIAADTVTLTGAYQGNTVAIDVTVHKPQFTLAKQTVSLFGGAGDTLLNDYPTQDEAKQMQKRTVAIDLPETVAGTVEEVNVTYKQVVGGNTDSVTRNILTAVDSDDARKITVRPSFYTFNMGDVSAQVVTEKAVYTLPLSVYTMIIDSKADLDAFRYYTTYQNEWKETATAGEYAPILWDGYFVLGDNITYNESVDALAEANSVAELNKLDRYKSFITSSDMLKFLRNGLKTNNSGDATLNDILCGNCSTTLGDYGFCGIFDGCGYNIKGMIVENATTDMTVGNILQVGGFIGMLTSHTFGSDTVNGTIRNIAFTDFWHGRINDWDSNSQYGTEGGYVFSVSHGMCVENIYLRAKAVYYADALLGSEPWFLQLFSAATLRNIVAHVEKSYYNHYNLTALTQLSLTVACPRAYHGGLFENIYTVLDSSYNGDGNKQDSSYVTKMNVSELTWDGTDRTTIPEDAFATFGALASHINGKTDTWDSDYWEFAAEGDNAGTPVFKTKTNA